ncbi:MAG: NAD-dependent epimerase/dehydratase family protein [Pseudomonadota bacterium]
MAGWLITGGCGFIGRNLVEHLMNAGEHGVRMFDNLEVGRSEDLAVTSVTELRASACGHAPVPGSVELVVGDLADARALRASARGCDVIVHLAAATGVAPSVKDPHHDCAVNVIGTLNCLDAARQVGISRFVFASSGAPLGAVRPPLNEDLAPRPLSPYGASKLAGEGYCSAYFHSYGIDTVALRFSNVYGPGSDHKSSIVAAFIRRALAGKPLEIFGDGTQTRDFIYVGDLVRAIEKAAAAPDVGGQIFQIATACETTVAELAELLISILREAGLPQTALQHAQPRIGDAQRSYADTSKARQMLGWEATTSLEQGLRYVVAWFKEQEVLTRMRLMAAAQRRG